MAENKFFVDINLQNQELIGFKVDNETSDPAGLSGEGQLIYRTDTNVLKYHTGSGTWVTVGTSSGSMSSWVLTGDSGSNQTVNDGETVDIAGGTALTSVVGATNTVTLNLDNTSVTPGSYTYASITVDQQGRLTAASSGASPGTMSSWTLSADSGSSQTINDGNTVDIAGGTAISTVASATDTVTINLDNTSVTAGSYTSADITVDAQGRITAASSGGAGTMSSWTLSGDSGSSQTIQDGNTVDIAGGTYISTAASATDTLTVTHDNTSRSDTTSSASPGYGGTFDVIGSVTTNSTGHVTAVDVETITMPSAENYSWTLTGDSGSQTIANGNTVDIAGGTAITTAASATDTLTVTLDDTAVTPGSYTLASITVDQQGRITAASSGSSGSMSSWTLAGDSGSSQTITNGDTVDIAGGTGISTAASATDTLTITNSLPFNSITLAASSGSDSTITNQDTITIAAGSNISTTNNGSGQVTIAYTGGTGSMNSWILAGDSGSAQTISNGQTATIAGGTGLSSVASATDTVTLNIDSTGVSAGSYTAATITVNAQGQVTAASSNTLDNYQSWTLAGDSGSSQTIGSTNTATFTGGTNISTVASATDTLTINLDDSVTLAGTLTVQSNSSSAVAITGKATSASTAANDADTTLTTKDYVDGLVASALEFKGGFDGSTGKVAGTNDFLDSRGTQIACEVGDTYVVTVDGTFYTETVEVGDTLICQTAASAGNGSLSNWITVQNNIGLATATVAGIASFPTAGGLSVASGAVSLPNTGVSAGTYGETSVTQKVVEFTVDAKGRITAASEANVSITASQVTDFCTAVATCVADNSAVATIGDGSANTINVTHTLGQDVIVQVVETSNYATIFPEVRRTSTTNVQILTNTPIANNGAKVYIQKVS